MDWKNHIERAVKIAGTQEVLAEKANLSQQAISKMLSRKKWGAKSISAESAIAIERATGEQVKRHELRPDIFEKPAPTGAAA